MRHDLLPHERDSWIDTQPVPRSDPAFIAPAHLQAFQQRHQQLLQGTRATYGRSSLLDGLKAFGGQVLRLGIYAVALVFVLALLVSTLTGAP